MKKNIKTVLLIMTLSIVSSCGKSSSSSGASVSDLKSKDTMLIMQNSTKKDCTHSAVKEEIHGVTVGSIDFPYLIDRDSLAVKLEEGIVACSKYNRINDYAECGEWEVGDGSGKTCVVGLNYER